VSAGGLPVSVGRGPRVAAYRWLGDPVAVGVARRVLRRHLAQWDLAGLAESAELVLSELATNAQRHACASADRWFETWFERLPGDGVRIEVHDPETTRPAQQQPSPDAETGRGLRLVDVLTHGRWGVRDSGPAGKVVWAECADAGDLADVTIWPETR